MSISLNVVRIAAVRCASTSRSAMRLRSRVIGTRSVSAVAGFGAGAAPRATAEGAAGAGACSAAAGAGCFSSSSSTRSTSSLVSRPPLPVPWSSPGSRECSARSLRTAGLSGASVCGRGPFPDAGFESRAGAAAGLRLRRAGAVRDARHDGSDFDRLTGLLEDLESAACLRGNLHGGLVGLELEQNVVDGDGLSVFLEPSRDHALGHRLTQRRNANLHRHANVPVLELSLDSSRLSLHELTPRRDPGGAVRPRPPTVAAEAPRRGSPPLRPGESCSCRSLDSRLLPVRT